MKHLAIALLCCIIWHIMRSMAAGNGCPSDLFAPCANDGHWCTITSDITQGYLAYGAVVNDVSKWSFMPFTNQRGSDLQIVCNGWLGIPGDFGPKVCCFIEVNVGILNPTEYEDFIGEGRSWYWSEGTGFITQRFGKKAQFLYRVIKNAEGACSYKRYGEMIAGHSKGCNYKYGAELSPPGVWNETADEWEVCATEGNVCAGLSTSSLNWIRYGTDEKFYYKLVLSSDGTIICNDNLFQGRPTSKAKTCWRAPAESPHFQDIIGQWTRVPHCVGCDQSTYTIEATVTSSSTISRTEEWASSLQVSASAGFEFAGGGTNVEMTATVSKTVTDTALTTSTLTSTNTITRTCAKSYYYQFDVGAEQFDGISAASFQVTTGSTFCSTSVNFPKCPPSYCLHDDNDPALQDCQNCTAQYRVDSQQDSLTDIYREPPRVANMTTFNITDNITVITTAAYYSTLDADDYVLRHLPNSWMSFLVSCLFVYYV